MASELLISFKVNKSCWLNLFATEDETLFVTEKSYLVVFILLVMTLEFYTIGTQKKATSLALLTEVLKKKLWLTTQSKS